MLRGTAGLLLDGSWHHLAIAISSDPAASPYLVLIDGEPWEPDFAASARFLQRGLVAGGELTLGCREAVDEGGSALGSPYAGELREVNLWDRALPRLSAKQLAAAGEKWKFPGNVVSWSQLTEARSGAVELSTARPRAAAGFVWLRSLPPCTLALPSPVPTAAGTAGFYVEIPGKSLYGSLSAEGSLASLPAAKAQCTALGRACSAVVSTAGAYYLYRGTRLVSLEDPATDPAAAVHVKAASSLCSLDPEELALVSMVQFQVSQSLSLTSENEQDQTNASKIIYSRQLP
nr:uncharacterized protein LOC112547246 [Pelodiscus sinensis]|eukprot:XP_025044871.1 uncharacterized protein LOC112547246 [Pelodiscus sinensis]